MLEYMFSTLNITILIDTADGIKHIIANVKEI